MLTKQEEDWVRVSIESLRPLISGSRKIRAEDITEFQCAINEAKTACQKAEEKLKALAQDSYAEARKFGGAQ